MGSSLIKHQFQIKRSCSPCKECFQKLKPLLLTFCPYMVLSSVFSHRVYNILPSDWKRTRKMAHFLLSMSNLVCSFFSEVKDVQDRSKPILHLHHGSYTSKPPNLIHITHLRLLNREKNDVLINIHWLGWNYVMNSHKLL